MGLFLVTFFALAESGLLLSMEIGVIRAYRQVGSPVARKFVTCRYRTSCSKHALLVLQAHGFWRGNALLAKRLAMCSPLGWAIDEIRGAKKDENGLVIDDPPN